MKKPAAAIKIGMIVRRLEGTLGNDLANDMCDRKLVFELSPLKL